MISFRSIAERMDAVSPPERLGGDSTPWLQEGKGIDWLKDVFAYNFVSKSPIADEVGLVHKRNKGLLQMHRWYPSAGIAEKNSFRAIAKRHQLQPAWTFKFLWYNTWLLKYGHGILGTEKPFVEERCKEIGRAISNNNYHIVGLCEMFRESERDTLRQIIGENHRFDSARGPESTVQMSSGLMTFGMDKVNIRSRKGQVFEEEGGGLDQYAEKGMLYTELELCPPGSEMRPAIDLFITHLHAEEADTRSKQVEELAKFIGSHRKSNNPVIVAGDFNINNLPGGNLEELSEYVHLYEKMGEMGLYDIWLSRGGFWGGTNVSENEDDDPDYTLVCPFDPNDNNPSCRDNPTMDSVNTESIPGKRLDYVFVEAPKKKHDIIIDIPRVRRKPFWRGPKIEVDDEIVSIGNEKFWSKVDGEKVPNFMSDHLGIEMDLIVSPAR
ncbi:MAG: hypothetical protein D3904_00640 [Candidatus Electrothrix sp. EH2]|nr:hypothetical protein [Candidatus Electrothrix sp. EH2]